MGHMSVEETSLAFPLQHHESTQDKTAHLTLSLYISNGSMQTHFSNWNAAERQRLRSDYAETRELREAIDPMFNDIAIRERNSVIDEFLIDVEGEREVERIQVTFPAQIDWDTEGKTFRVQLGQDITKELKCRMFWYAHTDGALSYHMSFIFQYAHAFEDYYFLSLMQKLLFPKEFTAANGGKAGSLASRQTGLALLDGRVVRAATDYLAEPKVYEDLSFWEYVRKRFTRQFADLAKAVRLAPGKVPLSQNDVWNRLVEHSEFLEVPGLTMPVARALFLFQDTAFFHLLQPEPRQKILENMRNYVVKMPPAASGSDKLFTIDKDFFDARPEGGGDFDIRYYFLAGFFQNIIDFLNQDVTELRDGTDPIYPGEEDAEEAFFVRFANSRALYQVVQRSRSLEVGNDYIGTCPYVFLTHLLSLHNEFLVRRLEAETAKVQSDLERGNLYEIIGSSKAQSTSGLKRLTQIFYSFRYRVFSNYTRHLYDNIFRYDTERDLFEDLERIRGTRAKLERCNTIAAGLDKTIEDVEEDTRYQEQETRAASDRNLNKAVALVGFFSVLQVFYAALDAMKPQDPAGAYELSKPAYLALLKITNLLAGLSFAVAVILFAWLVLRWASSKWR